MFKVNNKDTRWRHSGVFIKFEHISHIVLSQLITKNFPVSIYLLKANKENTRTIVWNMFNVNKKTRTTSA